MVFPAMYDQFILIRLVTACESTDGAANEQKAAKLMHGELPELSAVCTSHTVALIVTAGITVGHMGKLMTKVHDLCVSIRASKVIRLKLRGVAARMKEKESGLTLEELLAPDAEDDEE